MLKFKYEIGMIVEDIELGTEYKIIDKYKTSDGYTDKAYYVIKPTWDELEEPIMISELILSLKFEIKIK